MKTKFFTLFLILTLSNLGFTQAIQTNKQVFENPNNSNEVSVGTIISVQIESEISSKNSAVNDTFLTALTEAIVVNGVELLPAKTVIQGRISKVEKSARGGKPGILELTFDKIKFLDGSSREMKGELVDLAGKSELLKGKSATVGNVALIGGGIGVGTTIGIASGGNKSVIGGLLGAGIGISSVFLRKGDEATLKANSKLVIKITEKLVLPVKDY